MDLKLINQLLGPGIYAVKFQNHAPLYQSLRALGLICLRLWKAARLPHLPSEAGAFQLYICRASVDSGPYF